MNFDANPLGATDSSSETSSNKGTDVNGAVSRLSALFQSEPNKPTDAAESPKAAKPQTAAAPQEQPKATPETPQGDTGSADNGHLFEFEDIKLDLSPLDESVRNQFSDALGKLKLGNMMERDYRHKTSGVAEQRRAIEQKGQEVDQHLAQARTFIESEAEALDSPEMRQLRETDPDDYLNRVEKLQAKAKQWNELKQAREQEHKAQYMDYVNQQREALFNAVPDWLDESTRNKDMPEIGKALLAMGYKEDELSNINDHRLFVMARKAMLYDRIQNQKPEDKKVKSPPRSIDPGTTKTADDQSSDRSSRLRQQAKKSGHIRDAQSVIQSFLN